MTSSRRRVISTLVRKVLDTLKTLDSTDFNVSELETMERALQAAAAKLRGMRNSVQPINRLPPELLAHIFSETQPRLPSFLPLPLSPHNYITIDWYQWTELLEVCRHWRGVIASSPALWSTVCSSAKAPAFIRRSYGVDLTVYLGLRSFGFPSSLMNDLAPHTSRFKEFHMRAKGSEDHLKHQLFSSPAPRLKSLLIEVEEREELSGDLPPIFSGHMPKLRQLALGYFTAWPKGYFHNLASLCLFNQRASSLPTTIEFLDFLESSPRIEELALLRGGPIRPLGTDVAPPDHRLVSLKRLQKLDLGGWPSASTIARFLSHLSLPRKTTMYFWGDSFLGAEDLSALLPQDTSHLHNLKKIKGWFLVRYAEPAYPTFKLVSVADSTLYMRGAFYPSQIRPSAMSRYQLSKVHTLRLCEEPTQIPLCVSDWKDLLGLVPEVEFLHIRAPGSPQFTRAVISALRPPKLFPPSLPTLERVPCPALKMIEIMEETELPFLHICSLSAERISHGAPEISFKFCSRSAPRHRAFPIIYQPDSDSDVEYGFDAPGSGAHIPRMEYVQVEAPLMITHLAWPTQAYLWAFYLALTREYYI